MPISFPFEKLSSDVFKSIYRPYATVFLRKDKHSNWVESKMIIDTGADFTLLPVVYAWKLGINLKKDCQKNKTFGIGGEEVIYLYHNLHAKIGKSERKIPVGFLAHNDVPALLGRHEFLETFKVVFDNRISTFS